MTNGIRTASNPVYDNIGTVVWAAPIPDTDWIYILAHNGNGWYRTYRCNADLCDQPDHVQGISTTEYGWSGGLSLAGDRLLYGQAGNYNLPMTLRSADLVGNDKTTLVSGLQPWGRYQGSPDAGTVAYADQRGTRRIRLVDAIGGNDRELSSITGVDLFSGYWRDGAVRADGVLGRVWSPDSETLVFGSDQAGLFHVFKIGVDGTGLTQMTSGPDYNFSPSFSPDGEWISFHRLPEDHDDTIAPAPIELVVVCGNDDCEEP